LFRIAVHSSASSIRHPVIDFCLIHLDARGPNLVQCAQWLLQPIIDRPLNGAMTHAFDVLQANYYPSAEDNRRIDSRSSATSIVLSF